MPATAPSEVELGHALPARAGGGTGGPLDPPARLATSRTSGDPLVAGAGGDPEEPSTAAAPAAGLDYADYLAARAANAPGARLAAWCATRPHALCNVPALAAWALAAVLVVVLAGRSGGRPSPGGLASTGGDAGLSPEGRLAATAGVGADYRGRPRSLLAAGGAVASDHGRCSDAGAAILRAGGNAADAAVTTALCLGVHNPMASGIGGGALILVRGAKGAVTAIDAREAAPAGAAADMYGSSDTASLEGGLAVGVPMELWGLHTLHADHGSGRVAWADLVRPAADAARAGFEAHPYMVAAVSAPRALARLKASPALAAAFLVKDAAAPGGYRPPRVNETCCARPALAATLDAVGRDGPAALYSGARAAALAADVRAAGGILTEADLAAAAARSAPPLTTRAWGMDFYVPPPPSSGAALLAALAIAAGWEAPLPFERGLGAHRLVEAMKHGMALRVGMGDVGACGAGAGGGEEDGSSGATAPSPSPAVSPPRRHFHLLAAADAADPACFPGTSHVPALIADALTPAFAARLRASIADNATAPPASYGGRWGMGAAGAGLPPEDHGTSHLSVVDADRQAVSLTTTGELFYGRMGGGNEEGRSFYLFSTCLSPLSHPIFFFLSPLPLHSQHGVRLWRPLPLHRNPPEQPDGRLFPPRPPQRVRPAPRPRQFHRARQAAALVDGPPHRGRPGGVGRGAAPGDGRVGRAPHHHGRPHDGRPPGRLWGGPPASGGRAQAAPPAAPRLCVCRGLGGAGGRGPRGEGGAGRAGIPESARPRRQAGGVGGRRPGHRCAPCRRTRRRQHQQQRLGRRRRPWRPPGGRAPGGRVRPAQGRRAGWGGPVEIKKKPRGKAPV